MKELLHLQFSLCPFSVLKDGLLKISFVHSCSLECLERRGLQKTVMKYHDGGTGVPVEEENILVV